LLPPESPEWEISVAHQVKDFIGAGFYSSDLLTRQQLSDLIRAATDAEGLAGICRLLGVCASSVVEWRVGRKLPLLPAYLRIACALNVTLADLLTGKVEPSSIQSIDVLRVPYWRAIRVRKRASFDVHKARQRLNEALRESPPPSLTSFQKRTRYHYGTLRGHFPDLCAQLCERFQRHQAATIENRLQGKICEFRNIAYQLHAQGVELLVNRVLKRMSCPRSLVYRVACELLADIKREILSRNNHPGDPLQAGA
jgi:hypothetical protein